MFYFRSEINSQAVKQVINKLFSNRLRFNKKHKIPSLSSVQMSNTQEENKKNIKQKPELHVDSQENPRLTDYQNMSPGQKQ